MNLPVRERDWQQTILEAAQVLGWRCYHPFDNRRSDPGWPDLACAKPGRPLLLIEVKTEKGRVRPEQQAWLELLERVPGVVAMIARPSDWPMVEGALKGEHGWGLRGRDRG